MFSLISIKKIFELFDFDLIDAFPQKTHGGSMRYVIGRKNKHKISKNVVFLGNSNEIDKILCFTDLFLLPSEQESFGLAALEAMVHKVAVDPHLDLVIKALDHHAVPIAGFLLRTIG